MKNPRPYKPRKNYHNLCEATVGVDYSQKSPRLIRCTNKAEWLYMPLQFRGRTVRLYATLCSDCLKRLQESENERVDGTRLE